MKVFGSISRLVSILFRKDGQDITLRPNQSTTYTAPRDIQLPSGDANHELVSTTASQSLSNKSIDGDNNTLSNVSVSSLKSSLSDADKVLVRDINGAVVSSKIQDKHIHAAAAIALSKLAALSANKALVSDANGVISASSVSSQELSYLSGVTSSVQSQLDAKASKSYVDSEIASVRFDLSSEEAARIAADSELRSDLDSEIARAQAAEFSLRSDLDSEIFRAQGVEDELRIDLEAEISRAKAAEAAEASARAAADAAESAARIAADSAEASARAAADAALDMRLDVIEGDASTPGSIAKSLKDSKDYTDMKVAAVIAGAPAMLDTLKELADAINDDENFGTHVLQYISEETAARQAKDALQDAEIAKKLNKPTSGDQSGYLLQSNGDGSTSWVPQYQPKTLKLDWVSADGMTKVISHSFNTTDVIVTLYDKADNAQIGINSVVATNASTITLNASEAPESAGWRVIIQAL